MPKKKHENDTFLLIKEQKNHQNKLWVCQMATYYENSNNFNNYLLIVVYTTQKPFRWIILFMNLILIRIQYSAIYKNNITLYFIEIDQQRKKRRDDVFDPESHNLYQNKIIRNNLFVRILRNGFHTFELYQTPFYRQDISKQ